MVSKSLPWALAVALGAGGLGGGVTVWLMAGVWGGPEASLPNAVEATELDALDDRLERLEGIVARQEAERRIDSVARDLAGTPATSHQPERNSGAVDVEGAATVDDPVFQAAVRDIVDQVGEEQSKRREAEREQRRRQLSEAWSQQLAEDLALDAEQRSQVSQLAEQFFASVREAWRQPSAADAGVRPWQERRDRAQELRSRYEQQLSEVLTPDQFQRYQALEMDHRLGGPGRARRAHGAPSGE